MSLVQEATASLRPGGEPIVAKRPPLAVSLLDAFSASHDGQPLAIKNKKAQAVVAYLLLAPGRRETRERLCGLLWSEFERGKGPRLSPPGLAPAPGAVRIDRLCRPYRRSRRHQPARAAVQRRRVGDRRERGGDRGRAPAPSRPQASSRDALVRARGARPVVPVVAPRAASSPAREARAPSRARARRGGPGAFDSGRPRDRAPEPRSDPRGRLPHPDGGPRGTWRHGRRAQGLQGVVGPPGRRIRQRAVGSDQGPRGPDQDRRVQGQGTRRKRRKRLARAAARSIRSAVESPLLGQRPAVGACRPGA